MDRRTAVAVYLVLGACLGVIVGLNVLPEPILWTIIAAGSIAAWLLRSRVLHAEPWSGIDLAWLAAFAVTWLPISALLGRWPFR
jgi:hypothetical protein